eukprot:323061-Prymnesium_polylepis.2
MIASKLHDAAEPPLGSRLVGEARADIFCIQCEGGGAPRDTFGGMYGTGLVFCFVGVLCCPLGFGSRERVSPAQHATTARNRRGARRTSPTVPARGGNAQNFRLAHTDTT